MDSPLDVKATITQVYDLIKADQKAEARQLVRALFLQDKTNPDVLYLAAYFTENPEQKIKLLERILTINPDHPQAKQILVKIQSPQSTVSPSPQATSSAALPSGSPPRPSAFDLDGLLARIQSVPAISIKPAR